LVLELSLHIWLRLIVTKPCAFTTPVRLANTANATAVLMIIAGIEVDNIMVFAFDFVIVK
jgi:hypothetical protein